ncbi:YIP1 family protein [Pseudooceanicola algae]|uniref:Yip1 domain-containing protein n=1 Tax=Pseudooceanicola algae TaxID=1537215 RepID=A0A418SE50_9RHOB|nr:YIP1 family protein [Pseudooceanicola algae]QPM89641.1 hypothetical protein PSAL_008630 [Pseudooceanicola algae]
MTSYSWRALARQSILDPRAAAPILTGRPLPRGVLPLALALVATLNGIFFGLVLPADLYPGGLASPIPLAIMVGGLVWTSAAILAFVGQLFGGQGRTEDLLRIGIWMQFLRLGAQILLTFAELLLPGLAWMLAVVAWIWGLYMTICFTAAAHRFDTLLKAAAVLGVTFFTAVLALSVVLAVFGLAPVAV